VEDELARGLTGAVGRDLDRHAGPEVAGVERRGGRGANDLGGGVVGDAGPLEQADERLAALELLEARQDRCRRRRLSGLGGRDWRALLQELGGTPLRQLRREPECGKQKKRHHRVGGGANASWAQSICLRMKVGISMSLRSCDPAPVGGVGIGARGALGRSLLGRAAGGMLPPTRAGRLPGNGMTGAPLGAVTGALSCAGVTRPG
jgi:hypothetical protein